MAGTPGVNAPNSPTTPKTPQTDVTPESLGLNTNTEKTATDYDMSKLAGASKFSQDILGMDLLSTQTKNKDISGNSAGSIQSDGAALNANKATLD